MNQQIVVMYKLVREVSLPRLEVQATFVILRKKRHISVESPFSVKNSEEKTGTQNKT